MSPPRSLTAFVLVIGTAVAIVALAIGAAWTEASNNGHVSDQAATLLSTVLGAAVGAIATYLGGRIATGNDEPSRSEQPTQPWPTQKGD